jgi:Vesicle transport v-SNARE protein N-terminus
MSTMFESYHEEFVTLSTDLSRTISHASTYESNPTARSTQLRQANALIGQADDLLKQMEVEARSSSDAITRKDLQGKVRGWGWKSGCCCCCYCYCCYCCVHCITHALDGMHVLWIAASHNFSFPSV